MTCENDEWTIELVRDNPSTPSWESTLVFCIEIDGNAITGDVYEGVEPTLISSVTGTYAALTGVSGGLISLDFTWSGIDVCVAGVTYDDNPTKLTGRYWAYGSSSLLEEDPAPADGDTGTATGQQT